MNISKEKNQVCWREVTQHVCKTCKYMEKSTLGRRNSKCQGPEADVGRYVGGTVVRSLWLEHSVWEEELEKMLEKDQDDYYAEPCWL